MVLPANNNFDQIGGLAKSSSPTPTASSLLRSFPTKRSWAQVVTKNRKSLLHSTGPDVSINKKGSETTGLDIPTVVKTSIWRPDHGPGSVFVDMTGRTESKLEFLSLVAQQYPTRVGVLTQQVGSLKFAEINFDSADTALNDCLTNGIKFADHSIALPCRALDSQMQVVRLRLSNLPFLGEKALLEGLKKSLQIYGEILDVGILLEPNTGTYMCTGYAILNVFSQEHIFEPLTHLIPWDESREQGFYAVWNQMPHYCRYCHEEGHVVVNCPKRRNRHTCWNCGENGHMAVSYTRDKPSKRARKQPETASVVQPIVAQASVIDPVDVNEEVMEISPPLTDSVPPVEVPTVPEEVITQNSTIVAATTPTAITIATKPSSKRLRTLIKKSPYERPTTRSSSATPPVLTSTSSDDMKLDSTETIDNDAATDPSSSYHPAGEDNSNYLLQ